MAGFYSLKIICSIASLVWKSSFIAIHNYTSLCHFKKLILWIFNFWICELINKEKKNILNNCLEKHELWVCFLTIHYITFTIQRPWYLYFVPSVLRILCYQQHHFDRVLVCAASQNRSTLITCLHGKLLSALRGTGRILLFACI